MNKIQSATLLFLLLIILYIFIINYPKSSTSKSTPPKLTNISSDGQCSATLCGETGSQYRSVTCSDPVTGLRRPDSDCDQTEKQPDTQQCKNPDCSPWNYSAWSPEKCDLCIPVGSSQQTQTRTATCSDPSNGCGSQDQELTQMCSSQICGPNSYHNRIAGTTNLARSSNLFTSDVSVASGNLANNINISGYKITFYPTGNMIYGAYFCTFVYYQSPSSVVSALGISSSTNITLINLFNAGSATPYPISPNIGLQVTTLIVNMMIVIDDPTKISSITFNTSGGPKQPSTRADIFVTQMNSSILNCISGRNLVPCVDTYGSSRYPYLAIYRGSGGADPLDTTRTKNCFYNPVKVFDSFETGISLPYDSVYQWIVIPPLPKSGDKFLMFFQVTTPTNITGFSFAVPTPVNFTGQAIFANNTAVSIRNSISTVGSTQTLFMYCFSIKDVTIPSVFKFNTAAASSISGFDLVIIQLDAATV
jgi:hypothetical protein